MQLTEKYRPASWDEVVGQDKAIEQINNLRPRGLGGRAYFISGKSGTGKGCIAELLAAEVADRWNWERPKVHLLTPSVADDIERRSRYTRLGEKHGVAIIVNEVHGMRSDTVRTLLDTIEPIPAHVVWIFTTTKEAKKELFDDGIDAHPLTSRCTVISLAERDLAKPFAERAKAIAEAEGLDGQPIAAYVKLVNEHRGNFRAVLQAIDDGVMLAKGGA